MGKAQELTVQKVADFHLAPSVSGLWLFTRRQGWRGWGLHTRAFVSIVIVAVKLILCVREAFFLLSINESVLNVLKA